MSEKPKRPVLSGRRNPRTGQLEIYETTQEEADEALAVIKRWLDSLPPAKAITPQDIEAAAKSGAASARKFLAGNPSQEEIQQSCDWSFDDARYGDDSPASLAYDEAYRKVLKPRLP